MICYFTRVTEKRLITLRQLKVNTSTTNPNVITPTNLISPIFEPRNVISNNVAF